MMRVILSIFSLLIACFGIAQAPNAQFVASPLSVCVGQPISFTNQSTAGGSPITTYTWNFGNGETSSLQNTNFVYTTPGVYTITLAVQAANGQADAEVKTNYITVNPSPTASFTTSGNGCTVPFGVNFTNTSSSAPGITYAWNFGNGQTSNLQTPTTVTYSNAGTFNVALTVTDANSGCTASSNQSIVVSNFTAGINAPTSVCEGQAVQFLNSSTVGANSFAWNSGGAGTSTAQNPTFTYNTPGNYTVTLTAQNTTSGCSASTVHQITVLPAPTPSFTATPTSGCSPLVVNFSNTSTGSGTFVWNFGDGATFTGQTPTGHTYSGNGSYSVELVMTGTNGCSDSVTISNLITLSDPVAQFTS
ncbi:MAG: PKD domain-containing protein, partial [Crocinitomicaceae bacterium]